MSNQLQTNLDAILQDKNANLKPENLKQGVTCLGVEGIMQSGIDTSDATAIAKNIILNKTAYVNGEKITGALTVPISSVSGYRALNYTTDILKTSIGDDGVDTTVNKIISKKGNTYTYPDTLKLPVIKNLPLKRFGNPAFQFRYIDENEVTHTDNSGVLGLYFNQLFNLYPYYGIVVINNHMMVIFTSFKWNIQISNNGDMIVIQRSRLENGYGIYTVDYYSEEELVDVVPDDIFVGLIPDIFNSNVNNFDGTLGNSNISSTASISIYGNIEIIDNTTDHVFTEEV